MRQPSTTLCSRAWVEVDLASLCANALHIRDTVDSGARVVPMVKANAYGLGVEQVVGALSAELGDGLWALGVAAVAEAEQIRELGWVGGVLVFSPVAPGEFGRAADARATLCLSDARSVQRWAHQAERVGFSLAFHAEIDTGMGRSGFPWAEAAVWGEQVARAAAEHLDWEGCFTHFHSADEPDLSATDDQWRRFQKARAALRPFVGAEDVLVHVANSAAALRRTGYGADLVRPGIFLYGGSVGARVQPQPVAAVRARLVLVREVPPGTTVGYGATYAAPKAERWGTVSIGYGDGVPRRWGPAGGSVLIRGSSAPIIGRISMDVLNVDLSDVPDAQADDVVTLLGRDGNTEIRLDDIAERCGTISYEILCGLSPRLPRVYL